MGNGILPFIHKDVRYQDFFDNNEIETYSSSKDLVNKLFNIKDDDNKLKIRSKNAKKRYFEIFECQIVSDFIISKIFDTKNKFKYIWDK